jgi:hypothetical protein
MFRPSRDSTIEAILELDFEWLLTPMVLSERLFSFHPKIAGSKSADCMLKTSARGGKT